MEFLNRKRLIILIMLMIVTPLGFFTKFYTGPAEVWVNNSFGGLLYEVFWCLVFTFILLKTKPIIIAFWVFTITCILEVLQLWHPPFLEYLRGNFIGRTILGNSFNWLDFPYYFFGCLFGFLLLIGVDRFSEKTNSNQ